MTTRLAWLVTLAAAMLIVPSMGAGSPAATPTAAEAKAPPTAIDELLRQLKQPTPWLCWGADFRARNEYYNNIVTLAATSLHEQDVFRLRWRVWAAITAAPNLTLNARLAAEARYWERPAFVGAFKTRTGWEQRFGLFDTFAVKWTHPGPVPVTLTVGRQDIMLGDAYDWWLVMDGTPGDGSWTTYFDAARLTVEAPSIRTKFDVIGLVQNPPPDFAVPTIGRSTDYPVTDQKEKGAILYASNRSLPNVQVDGYFIAKHDQQQTCTVAGVSRLSGDNAEIFTVGSKVTGTPGAHLRYSIEGAYQFGRKQDRVSGLFAQRDLRAYGGKGRLSYAFNDSWNQQLSVNGELLSGDDPGTRDTDEMFDNLWGRWPLWSEMYIYSVIYETGGRVAQMNNLARLGVAWSCVPLKGTSLSLAYNSLYAPESTPTRAVLPALFSHRGHFRGHHVQAVVKRQFSKYLSGHLWAEWIWQGDYYAQRELLTFLRAELAIGF